MDLRGKRALVTGAGQRVGAAIAERVAAAGATVAVHYHRSSEGAELVCRNIAAQGGQAFALRADLSDANQVTRLMDEALAGLGGLDLLVASAAGYDRQPFVDVSADDFDRSLALNVRAPFLLAQAARPALSANGGSIVLVTCTSPRAPYSGYASYIVSKGALQTLMRVLAVELAPEIRVNAVAPGTVLPPVGLSPAELGALVEATPLSRIGSATDVADAVVYLATAPFVTGVEIVVDGGRSIGGL